MILFETPGLLDFRSFTVMGLSAKPNSVSPIGRFGTGLKYAAALITRLGGTMTVFVGRDKYSFHEKNEEFRGKAFTSLQLKRERWGVDRLLKGHYIPLPFTTEYGKFWEPWMVFRELEANTRDENGSTERVHFESMCGEDNCTRIFVDLPGVDEAYNERDAIFLPDADGAATGVQVLELPSKYLYWRGLRVYEPAKPLLFTYNFGKYLTLTEDRTLAYIFEAQNALVEHLVTRADESTLERILTADEKYWESDLGFDVVTVAPSEAFKRVMSRYPKGVNVKAQRYYGSWVQAPQLAAQTLYERHPTPWTVGDRAVYDAANVTVFDAPYGYNGVWRTVAESICEKLGVVPEPEVEEVTSAPTLVDVSPTPDDDVPF